MNIVVLSLLILCYSLVLGIIFAQVLLTAPVVFKVLDDESASKFLRKIFPRYYLLILLISLISSLISYLWFEVIDLYISLSVAALAFIGYAIIPITNFARDRGWDNLFKWMHNLSVVNTVLILLISLTQLIRIISI
jgi:magnesium-transporting ATPase (P-type)